MKKKILSIALIAMSLVSFTGIAQTTNASGNEVKTEKVMKSKGDRKDMKGDRKDKKDHGRKGDKEMRQYQKKDAFEGLTLNDSQRQQLEQLNSERRAARQQQMMARKETKQRNDSARMAERRADKKAYLEKVKAIVGPEQYVVFLENVYVNGNGGGQQKAMMHKAHKDGKKDFAKKHGDKKNYAKHQGDKKGKPSKDSKKS